MLSLRVKLLAVLLPLMAGCLLMAMFGLATYLSEFFRQRAQLETARLGRVVELALRQSMLRTETTLGASLADVERTPGIRRIWVIDKNGRVAHAGDRTAVGRMLDGSRHSICRDCHAGPRVLETRAVFTQDEAGTPVLRSVRTIPNDKACWECHEPKIRINGVLLLEQSAEPFQTALWTIQRHLAITGGITLGVLALISLVLITFLVKRPVSRLLMGVRKLGKGDLTVRVPIRGRDELAELAESFNAMAEDLGRSIDEIRNYNAELSVVYSILERLAKTIDLADLKEVILQTMLDVFEADQTLCLSHLTAQKSGEILLKIRGRSRLYRLGCVLEEGIELPEGFPLGIADRWSRGELLGPFVTEDRQLAVMPAHSHQRQTALVMIRREKPFGHAEANPNMLRALAAHVGVAFENARLYTLAISDDLTGLFSRRHFEGLAAAALCRRGLPERTCGLILLDLDHFKHVNDRHGHLSGDEVLRQIAGVLTRSTRFGDSAYRFGGEEFAILLPEADGNTAWAVADRIRKEIAALKVPLNSGASIAVTASLGIAIFPQDGTSVQELVAAADAALYASKREGRDRVSFCSRSEAPASPQWRQGPGKDDQAASPAPYRPVSAT